MFAQFLRPIQQGFKSLMLHKMRSGLAMLGILIGVTSVIWLVSLGEGVSYQAQQQIKDLGASNIIIKSVKPAMNSSQGGSSLIVEYGLTRDDYIRIAELVSNYERIVSVREIKTEARAGSRMSPVQLLGCGPAYLEVNHLTVAAGRFITDTDAQELNNVAVLGADVAEQLFPYEDPIGRAVEITFNNTGDIYVIAGVTESRMPSASIGGSLEGRDYNSDIYIPLTTLRARIGDQVVTSRSGGFEGELVELSQITITMQSTDEVPAAAELVQTLLEQYHKFADYSVTVPIELLRQAEMLRMMFNILLILIAGISLLVGGIGIMNIMLATVTERTREIGIRRAIGAKRTDIIQQFLAETIVLSTTGGMLGMIFGLLCWPVTDGVKFFVESYLPEVWSFLPPTIQNLRPILAPWSIVVSVAISIAVGVIFGLYPAQRAAMKDPIEALRHE